ncbi:hypothetical protein ACM66B_004274 [Microbotryomycetes sp. NB124-2]
MSAQSRRPPTASTSKANMTSTRLYVGNLAPSVDEYSLMQLCSRHGKITKLDFLFHKTGALKGKPRGYAFVEFETVQEAQQARNNLHDKLVRGRKLNVMQASEQQTDERTYSSGIGASRTGSSGGGGYHGRHAEPLRPTTISLLKGQGVANASTDRKIAALEAKLASIKRSKPTGESDAMSSRQGTPSSAPTQSQNVTTKTTTITSSEEFLAELQGELQDGKPATTDGESEEQDVGPERKIKVDARKAGLPAKPTFQVQMPP